MPEAFELCDQPPGVGLVVTTRKPVRNNVLIGLVLGEHVPGRHQDRVRNRHLRPTSPTPLRDPRVLRRQKFDWYIRATDPAASTNIAVSHLLPCRLLVGVRLPADSWTPGATPAHSARCAALGLRDMSAPVFTTMT